MAGDAAHDGASAQHLTPRMFDRLVVAATIVMFCAAVFVLIDEFASVDLGDVLPRLAIFPPRCGFREERALDSGMIPPTIPR